MRVMKVCDVSAVNCFSYSLPYSIRRPRAPSINSENVYNSLVGKLLKNLKLLILFRLTEFLSIEIRLEGTLMQKYDRGNV